MMTKSDHGPRGQTRVKLIGKNRQVHPFFFFFKDLGGYRDY